MYVNGYGFSPIAPTLISDSCSIMYIFQLSTISSLVIGILLLTDYDDYEDLSSGGTYAKAVAWVLIVNSIVSFVGGIIGCFGLRLANRCLLSLVCMY